MPNDRKLKTLRMNIHVVVTCEGLIVGGGIEAKTCTGGPSLNPGVLDTKELRDQLARLVFDIDGMAPGKRREVR
jgi:hypothetical protein